MEYERRLHFLECCTLVLAHYGRFISSFTAILALLSPAHVNGKTPDIPAARPANIKENSLAARSEPSMVRPPFSQQPRQIGHKPWAVICVRFADVTATPHPLSYYTSIESSTYPGVDNFWRDQSGGKVDFAGTQCFGWFNLPHPKSYYVDPGSSSGMDWDTLRRDAVAAAGPDVHFEDFYGIQIMLNDSLSSWSGIGVSKFKMTIGGVARDWAVTTVAPVGQNLATIAHECGHGLGLPHSTGTNGQIYSSTWDIMSGGSCGTLAWQKEKLGWIPKERCYVASPGTSKTFDLERSDQPVSTSNVLLVKIPIESGGQFYTVEARRHSGYDDASRLPTEAVVIHKVDLSRESPACLVAGSAAADAAGGVWRPGKTFTDPVNGVTVSVNAITASGFNITVKMAQSAPGATLVTTTADSGRGSLRNALLAALEIPGSPIRFAIPPSDAGYRNGIFHISLLTDLPEITSPGTVIDGMPASADNATAYRPSIEIDGNSKIWSALTVKAPDCVVRGIAAGGFGGPAITIQSQQARVEGCYIGVAASGDTATPNGWCGVSLDGAADCIIGGSTASTRNLISGNGGYGVGIINGSSGNKICGNWIGLNAGGVTAIRNLEGGILAASTAHGNQLGGTLPGESNVISGNGHTGIRIGDPGTTANTVIGNYIGTDRTGAIAIPNGLAGVVIANGATGNIIGRSETAARNIISGNAEFGLQLDGTGTSGNIAIGNYIGTDASGLKRVPNSIGGIRIDKAASANIIGGPGAADGNLISGNGDYGIIIRDTGTSDNTVQGNRIGIGSDGTTALGHNEAGIRLCSGATLNVIGGISTGEGNVIANSKDGIDVIDAGTSGNSMRGNKIWGDKYLAINLVGINSGWGITPNDVNDGDSGPNDLQNYPVLKRPVVEGATIKVSGELNTTPNTRCAIDLYSAQSEPGSFHRDPKEFLGTMTITTDASGNAEFTYDLDTARCAPGTLITATATNLTTMDTSELCDNVSAANSGLKSLALSQESTLGGAQIIATATLQNPAPSGGAIVRLSCADPLLIPQGTWVTVPENAVSVSYTIKTRPVATPSKITVIAQMGSDTASADLQVTPPQVSHITVSPNPVAPGAYLSITVDLTGQAPEGGRPVTLAVNSNVIPLASKTITVPAWGKSQTISLICLPVANDTAATITASTDGITVSGDAMVSAPTVTAVTLGTTSVNAPTTLIGRVALNGRAGASGRRVQLQSSDPAAASVPDYVTVTDGAFTIPFNITAHSVAGDTQVRITATTGTTSQSVVLMLRGS